MGASRTVDGVDVSALKTRVDDLDDSRISTPLTCSISIYSNIIEGTDCECVVYGMAVDFGTTGTALSGLASITNMQDDGIFEKFDQNRVYARKDDTASKMLFLLAHACDSNPAFGGMAIGLVTGDTCPEPEVGLVGATFIRNKGQKI